jgi:hypothetical protein
MGGGESSMGSRFLSHMLPWWTPQLLSVALLLLSLLAVCRSPAVIAASIPFPSIARHRWMASSLTWCEILAQPRPALLVVLPGGAACQAPHIHFLLLETADILGLHPLPKIQVTQSSRPFVRLLMVPHHVVKPLSRPAAHTAAAGDGTGSSNRGQQQQQQHGDGLWRREVLLLVSSAALQLLTPAELQAAMAAALVPALLEGEQTWYVHCCSVGLCVGSC